MKLLFHLILIFSVGFIAHAQDCKNELSLFNESAKAQIFEDALPRYDKLIKDCPAVNIVLYLRADKMFNDLLDAETDTLKIRELAKTKIENLNLQLEYFPDKSPIGKIYPKIGQIMFEHKIGGLGEQHRFFEEAWRFDKANFKSPKALYIYFLLNNNLYENGEIELNVLFSKYDDIISHIEKIKRDKTRITKNCLGTGADSNSSSKRDCQVAQAYFKSYNTIIKGMNAILGDRGTCEKLIPIYDENFEKHETDKNWLNTAAFMLNYQTCTKNPTFIKIVEALNVLDPSVITYKYLGTSAFDQGKYNVAIDYFNEAIKLEKDDLKKADLFYLKANVLKEINSYALALKNYKKAISLNSSKGLAYLNIAKMIEDSANQCGDNPFDKRAVYWLAESYARKAAAVDDRIKDNALENVERYRQLAPSIEEIFTHEKQGKTIYFKCWIGGKIKVPEIKKK